MLRFYVVQSIVLGIVVHELLAISRGVRKKTLRLSQISQDELLDSPFLTRTSLGLLRLAIGIFELGLIAHRCLMGPADNKFCNVVDEGKHCVPYGGIWLFATFTIWSWVGQGIYFFIIGLAPFVNLGRRSWLQQTLWVLYEIMFPMAILVTVVVWLVLVPYLNKAVEDGRSRNIETHQLMQRVLYSFSGLSFHCLNLVFMLLEFSLNKISIERAHRPFILLFGCAYVEFATVFHSLFGVWFYFFLDYRRNISIIFYPLLVLTVLLFFRCAIWLNERKLAWMSKAKSLDSRGRSRQVKTKRRAESRSPSSSLTSPPPRSRSKGRKRPGKSPGGGKRGGSRGASKTRVKTKGAK